MSRSRDALTRQRGAWSFEPFAREQELDDIEAMQETARALFWLAAWRGISHDVAAGIVGGRLLGSRVRERVSRHVSEAYDRASEAYDRADAR